MSRRTQPAKLGATDAGILALAALIGEVQASPTANTMQARLKTLATVLGEVQASPTANTLLDRVKALATQMTADAAKVGTLADAAWDGVTGDPVSLVALGKCVVNLLKDIKTNTAG